MQTYQLQPPSLDSHLDSQSKIMLRRITEGWINRAKVRREPVDLEFDPKRSDFLEALLPFHHHPAFQALRSEEHTSELQSLMRISYAVFCLKKNTITDKKYATNITK